MIFKKISLLTLCFLLLFVLWGCDNEDAPEQIFNSASEAESYAISNPQMRDKVFINQPDGTKISISEWTSNEWKKEREAEIASDTSFYEDKEDEIDKPIVELFQNGNINGVYNDGLPANITLTKPVRLKQLTTYHWNYGLGTSAIGTVEIIDQSGKSLGIWNGTGSEGQGGVINANWIFNMDISLPAGTYTIKDSDPSTWAQNSDTGGIGMYWGNGFFE